MIYAIPKPTDIELMGIMLGKIIKEPNRKYNRSMFENEFYRAKSKIQMVVNHPATINKIINATYNYLLKIGVIENVNNEINISPNINIDKNNIQESLVFYMKNYYSDFINEIKGEDNKVDKKILKRKLELMAEEEGRSTKKTTIDTDASYLYNRVISVLIEEKEIENTLMYKSITLNFEGNKLNNDVGVLELVRERILNKLNPHSKEQMELIRDKLLTDEFVDNILNKNYNNDMEYFLSDINDEDVPQPDYLNSVYNMAKSVKSIKSSIDKNEKILFLTDIDNDGSNAMTSISAFKNFYKLDNITVEFCKPMKNEYGETSTNHGINYPQIRKMLEKGIINKKEPILIVTADNGVNSNEEIEKILKALPLAKIIITDHHTPDELRTKENKRVMIVNPEFKTNKELLQNWKMCGAHVIGEILKGVIQEMPEREYQQELLTQIDTISGMGNFMDLVHSKKRITKLSTAKLLGHWSNILNAIGNMDFIWSKNNFNEDTIKKYYFATDIERKKIADNFKFLKSQSNTLVNLHSKISSGKITTSKEANLEINKGFENNVELDDENKMFADPLYLRVVLLDLISKNRLTPREETLFSYIKSNKILQQFKEYEKALFKPLRRNLDKIGKSFVEKSSHINVIKNSSDSNEKITRKFYKKLVPMPNNGVEINFDNIEENSFKGSMRTDNFIIEDIFTNNFLNKVKKETGIEIEIHGHLDGKARGIYFNKDNKIESSDIINVNKLISKQYDDLVEAECNRVNYVYDPKLLPVIHQIATIVKTPTSVENFKQNILVKADQIAFTDDVVTDVITEDSYNEDSENEEEENEINELGPGWRTANISIYKGRPVKLIARNSEIDKIQNNDFYQIKYLSTDTYIVEKKVKINNARFEYVEYKDTMLDRQLEFYKNNYNRANNFTYHIDKKEFVKNNFLIDNYSILERQIEKIMDTLKVDEFMILDTEGSGFGSFANLFNTGRLVFEKDKENNITLKNTNILNKIKDKLSVAIEILTGIKNSTLDKIGISLEEADEILYNLYKDKKLLIQAHNSPYDTKIIAANLPKFSKVMSEAIVVDTATIARNYSLAIDTSEDFGSIVIENKTDKNMEVFKTFIITKNDKNSLTNFMDNPEENKVVQNLNKDMSLEWRSNSKGELELIKRELKQDNKKIILGKQNEIEHQIKISSKAKKFSVVELLSQRLVDILKQEFEEDIVINHQLKLYITSFKSIDSQIDNILKLYSNRTTSTMLSQKEYLSKALNIFKNEKVLKSVKDEIYKKNVNGVKDIIDGFSNSKNKAERIDDLLSSEAEKLINNEIPNIINKIQTNSSNINQYNYSTAMKIIVHTYNPNLSKEANILNINAEMTLDSGFIEKVIQQIETLNKKMNKKYSHLLEMYNKEHFTDLFFERHNNLDFFSSDIALEGIVVMNKLMENNRKGIIKNSPETIYAHRFLDTESKMSVDRLRKIPSVNTYSFRQIKEKDLLTSKVEQQLKNYEKLLDKNQMIVKINEDYKMLIQLKNNYSEKDLEKLRQRIQELSFNIINYNVLYNTFNSSVEKMLEITEKTNRKTKEKEPVQGFEDFADDIKKGRLKKDELDKYKSNVSILSRTNQEKAINYLDKIDNVSKNLPYFKNTHEESLKELISIGDFEILSDNEKKIKTIFATIKNILTYIYNVETKNIDIEQEKPSENVLLLLNKDKLTVEDINSLIKSELENVIRKSKVIPNATNKEFISELNKEIKFYLSKVKNHLNRKMSKSIVYFNKLIQDEYIKTLFIVNKEESKIKFSNDMTKINKTTRSNIETFIQDTFVRNEISKNNLKYIPENGYPVKLEDIKISEEISRVRKENPKPTEETTISIQI